jgi:hypothetical protein
MKRIKYFPSGSRGRKKVVHDNFSKTNKSIAYIEKKIKYDSRDLNSYSFSRMDSVLTTKAYLLGGVIEKSSTQMAFFLRYLLRI